MSRFTVPLKTAANEMAREEILKQVAFLSRDIRNVELSESGDRIEFDAQDDAGPALRDQIESLANRMAMALRSLRRKIEFRSAAAGDPHFVEPMDLDGAHFSGEGQVVLEGVPLALYRYFDRVLEGFGAPWCAKPMMPPALIPDSVLIRCDYFRSFPQQLMFVTHLEESAVAISNFRTRHASAEELRNDAFHDMAPPRACLSPAMCFHVYNLYSGQTIPADGIVHGICGKCFRFESSNVSDLRRLSEFTMREVVFLGSQQEVLKARERSMSMMGDFLDQHGLAGEIRTASDPFFVAPDAISKTYFQLRSDSKFEVSLFLPGGGRTAVASHNYHSDFFGRAFYTKSEDGRPMHSVCVAFGLERWVYAFLAQHGRAVAHWPHVVRTSPEVQGLN